MLYVGLNILKEKSFVSCGDVAEIIFGTTLMKGATSVMKIYKSKSWVITFAGLPERLWMAL
jgi:hypothetical protein